MEKRFFLAIALSFIILLVWVKMFPPPQKADSPKMKSEASETLTTESEETRKPAMTETGEGEKKETAQEQTEPVAAGEGDEEIGETEPVRTKISGTAGKKVSLGNDRVKLDVLADGGTLGSFLLSRHLNREGEPVELLPEHAYGMVVENRPDLTERLNTDPYRLEKEKQSVVMTYSDGVVRVEKEIFLEGDIFYLSVKVNGLDPDSWGLTLGPKLRVLDENEVKSKFVTKAGFVWFSGEKLERLPPKKIKEEREFTAEGSVFLGLDDRYFAAILMPVRPPEKIKIASVEDEVKIVVYPGGDVFEARSYVGGKKYDELKQIEPILTTMVDFGWFSIIAKPMLIMLNWLFRHVHNYGFSIILLTFLIRMLLFPLTHKQLKSMKGMQKLQPKIEKLKQKYKKHKTDPDERAKMNQEMMALYRQEGVNPLGGCLPLLIQIPILWAFYNLLSSAIELRNAPFILWIQDLSAPDPLLVTPILMGVAMLAQQLMTPTAGSASQRKMFLMMPILFTFIFLGFPSGLVLYWLTNNIFQIMQTYIYRHKEKKEA